MNRLGLSKTKMLRLCLAAASQLCLPPLAWAHMVQGPTLSYEIVSAEKQSSRNAPSSGTRRRISAGLIAPLPAPIASGIAVLKVDLDRTLSPIAESAQSDAKTPPITQHSGTLALGGIYYPHFKEGAPRYFLAASRYARSAIHDIGSPLSEFEIGADIADVDAPVPIAPAVNDQASVHLSLRTRRAPGLWRVEPSLGYRLSRPSGWFIDLMAWRHLLLGFSDPGQRYHVYLGLRRSERPEAVKSADASGWILHEDTSVFVGNRIPLWPPVFVTVEAGAMRRTSSAHGIREEMLPRAKGEFAPFATVSAAVWLGTP